MNNTIVRHYYKDISGFSILNQDEELQLFKLLKNDDEQIANFAREQLVNAHLRFALSRALQASKSHWLPVNDLVQEANLAILQAVNSFNPQLGVRFHSYLKVAIRHALFKAVRQQGHMLKRPPISSKVKSQPTTQLHQLEDISLQTRPSVFFLPTSEIDSQLKDLSPQPAVQVAEAMKSTLINKTISELPPLVSMVIRLRYGVQGTTPVNHSEITTHLKVSVLTQSKLERVWSKQSSATELAHSDREYPWSVLKSAGSAINRAGVQLTASERAIQHWLHQTDDFQSMTQKTVAHVLNLSIIRVRELEQKGLRLCRRSGGLLDFWKS